MHERDKQRQAARMFEARAYRAGLNPDSAAYAGKERALPLVLALERLKAADEETFAQAQEAALAEAYNYETVDLEEAFRVRELIRTAMPNENAQPSRNPETGLQEFSGSRGYIPAEAITEPGIEEIVVTASPGNFEFWGGEPTIGWGGNGFGGGAGVVANAPGSLPNENSEYCFNLLEAWEKLDAAIEDLKRQSNTWRSMLNEPGAATDNLNALIEQNLGKIIALQGRQSVLKNQLNNSGCAGLRV